jgi:hypothetical protein
MATTGTFRACRPSNLERCFPEGEDAAAGRHQPVAAVRGRWSHAHDGSVQVFVSFRALEGGPSKVKIPPSEASQDAGAVGRERQPTMSTVASAATVTAPRVDEPGPPGDRTGPGAASHRDGDPPHPSGRRHGDDDAVLDEWVAGRGRRSEPHRAHGVEPVALDHHAGDPGRRSGVGGDGRDEGSGLRHRRSRGRLDGTECRGGRHDPGREGCRLFGSKRGAVFRSGPRRESCLPMNGNLGAGVAAHSSPP